jgi:hypothetical protein
MITIHHDRQEPSRNRKKWRCLFFLVLLVLIASSTPGCLKIMQQSGSGTNIDPAPPVQTLSENSGNSSIQNRVSVSHTPPTETIAAPASQDLLIDALPDLPADPYPVQHAAQINGTPLTNHYVRNAEATRTFVLRGNSTGLIVNATNLTNGPLWISFDVKPLYDCLEDVESCRGKNAKTISRPYFTLTVRDNQTRAIVAEDGYGREYSSQKDNRTIKIYGAGIYHMTLTGNSVDVILSVSTGAIPNITAVQATTGKALQGTTLPPEVLRRIYEGG